MSDNKILLPGCELEHVNFPGLGFAICKMGITQPHKVVEKTK